MYTGGEILISVITWYDKEWTNKLYRTDTDEGLGIFKRKCLSLHKQYTLGIVQFLEIKHNNKIITYGKEFL